MQREQKIAAAISAGVIQYLQQEQEALQAAQQPAAAPVQQARPAFAANSPWAMSGRQAIMERRYQWQMRLVR